MCFCMLCVCVCVCVCLCVCRENVRVSESAENQPQLISTESHQRPTHIRSSHGIPSVFKSLSPLLLGCLLHDHFELLKKP